MVEANTEKGIEDLGSYDEFILSSFKSLGKNMVCTIRESSSCHNCHTYSNIHHVIFVYASFAPWTF